MPARPRRSPRPACRLLPATRAMWPSDQRRPGRTTGKPAYVDVAQAAGRLRAARAVDADGRAFSDELALIYSSALFERPGGNAYRRFRTVAVPAGRACWRTNRGAERAAAECVSRRIT